jgi:hypothetical protein
MSLEKRLEAVADQAPAAFQTIGKFIAACSDLDAMVTAALATMAGMNAAGQEIVLHSVSFNQKREIVRAMLSVGEPTELGSELKSVVEKADAIFKKRHVAAHGMLVEIDGDICFVALNLPSVLRHAKDPTTYLKVSSLGSLVEQAEALSDQLHKIVDALAARNAS